MICFLGVRNKMHAVVLNSSRYRIFGLIKFFRGSTIPQAKQLIDVVVGLSLDNFTDYFSE